MKNNSESNMDRLLYGLPAIFHNENYIIFSPYVQKAIIINKEDLYTKKTLELLMGLKFLGIPKNEINDDITRITFFLTEDCNMACTYCYGSYGEGGGKMTSDLALGVIKHKINENIIKSNPEINISVHFSGGEASLNFGAIKDIVEFLEQSNINSSFRLSTNGVIKENELDYMIKKDFYFDLSCDGPPEIQNVFRPLKNGDESSSLVEATINKLVKTNSNFKVKSTITKQTTNKIQNIVKYLIRLGVKQIRLEPVIVNGRANSNMAVDPDEFVQYFFLGVEEAKKHGDFDCCVSSWRYLAKIEPSTYFCDTVVGNRIIIDPKGGILKCYQECSNHKSPFTVGKVTNNCKLEIDNKKIKYLKDISVEKIEKCSDCFAKYICSGGCYAENIRVNNNIINIYMPLENKCRITKSVLREMIVRVSLGRFLNR